MSEEKPEMEGGEVDLSSSTTPGEEDVVADVEKVEQSPSVAEGSEGEGSLPAAESGFSAMQGSEAQEGEEDQGGKDEGGTVADDKTRDEDISAQENTGDDDQEEVYEEVDNDEDDEIEMDVLQQDEGGKSPNQIQDLVNKAIESKLTGFQEQMEKMMAVLHTVSHGPTQDERAESEGDIFEVVEEERDDEEEEVEHVDEEEMRMAFGRQEEDEAVGDDSKPTETPSEGDVDKKQSKNVDRSINAEELAKREKMLEKLCAMLEIEPIVEAHERSSLDTKGNEIKYTVLPADSMIKDTWNKPSWMKASGQINSNLVKRYRWPQEDMEKYGRPMKVDAEAERLVRLATGRKKGRALPEEFVKIYGTTRNADSFVRFQQKIISYASYYLAALGKSVRGEKEAESEDLEEILSNLQQCLVDLCEVSVHTNTMLIRNQRRMYLNSMKLGHNEVQNSLLNLPFTSKLLFGDSLSEVMKKHGLEPPKMNVGQNGGGSGGSRRAGGRQGGNVGGGGGGRIAGGSGGGRGGGGGGGGRRRGGQSGGRARRGGEVRAGGGNMPAGRMGPSPGRMGASPGRGTNRGSGPMFSGRRDDRDRMRGVAAGGTGRRNEMEGGRKRSSGGNRNNNSKRRKGSDSKPIGTSWQLSGSFGGGSGGYMPLSRDLYPMGSGGMDPPSKMDYSRLLEEKARLAATKEQGGAFGSSFDTGSRSSMYPPSSSFGGGYYRLGEASYRGFMNFPDSDGPLLPKGPSGGLPPSKSFSSYPSYANDDYNQY